MQRHQAWTVSKTTRAEGRGPGGGDEDGDGEKKWGKKGGCVPIGTARRFKL